MFDLHLSPPQNFASYRQAELDNNRISTFSQMQQIPFISNRFALQRFLGLSKEEIAENEKLWREENDELFPAGEQDSASQMRSAGITGADISGDLETNQETEPEDLEGEVTGTEPTQPTPSPGNQAFTV